MHTDINTGINTDAMFLCKLRNIARLTDVICGEIVTLFLTKYWFILGNTSTKDFRVTKLTEGDKYLLRVCAVNSEGQSPWAEIKNPVTAKDPFGESWADNFVMICGCLLACSGC